MNIVLFVYVHTKSVNKISVKQLFVSLQSPSTLKLRSLQPCAIPKTLVVACNSCIGHTNTNPLHRTICHCCGLSVPMLAFKKNTPSIALRQSQNKIGILYFILGRAKQCWNFSTLLRDISDIRRFPTEHRVKTYFLLEYL